MTTVTRQVPFAIEEVFAELVDPTTYPHWLVGSRDIREVEDGWPEPGSRFHHRVGLVGPLKVADSSESLAVDPPHRLELDVRARPFVRAHVTFQLERASSTGEGAASTRIELTEEPTGPFRVLKPVLDPLTAARNRRSLTLLEDHLATGRSHRAPG